MKPSPEHPINRKWLAFHASILAQHIAKRLVEGSHGTINLPLTIRDGLIQSVADESVTVFRQTGDDR